MRTADSGQQVAEADSHVNSAYKTLNKSSSWPRKHIWRTKIPYKVNCFVWFVVKQACLTKDKLLRRGMQLRSIFLFCCETAETNNHLFLHCRVTTQLWDIFLTMIGLKWSMPQSTLDIFTVGTKGEVAQTKKEDGG